MLREPFDAGGIAAAAIDALSSNICVTDRDGVILAVNRAWQIFGEENSGSSGRSDVGKNYVQICCNSSGPGAEEADDFASGVRRVLEGKTELFELEYPCHSPSEHRWFLDRATPLRLQQGGAVISHLNITARKLMEFELTKLASTDPLTGLPNRRFFLEAANRELDIIRRFGGRASIVMIDLDHFKRLNDTYGHAAGDEALRSIKRVCRLREIDVLARWGGEEFIALLPGIDEAEAATVSEKRRQALSQISVRTASDTAYVSASLGVAEISLHDQAIGDAIARADRALYNAKKAGRDRVSRSTDQLGGVD